MPSPDESGGGMVSVATRALARCGDASNTIDSIVYTPGRQIGSR